MTNTSPAADGRRTRRRRYALPVSVAAALVCGAFYALDGVPMPSAVPPLGLAVGVAGALAPMAADDWDARRSIASNLLVWAAVVAIATLVMAFRMPDAQGALLAVPMLLAILAGWPIAGLHRQRDAYRKGKGRKRRGRHREGS